MPRVSIGVPVYNGERYLRAALDSLLAQTWDDFELIVCDNASTDSTQAICERYEAIDSRLRYSRSEKNLGAAPNFNRCFALADGEYFKWAAHDDLCEPAFLERCVEVLDANPDCVLAYPRTRIIDSDGAPQEAYDHELLAADPRPSVRFRSLLRGHRCFEIFGLIRAAALGTTPVLGSYSHSDGVLLARLGLLGRFIEIPEPLFLARRHDEQSMRMIGDHRSYAEWFDPRNEGRTLYPNWRISWEFLRSVGRPPLPAGERARCYVSVGAQIVRRRGRLTREVIGNASAFFERRLRSAARSAGPRGS